MTLPRAFEQYRHFRGGLYQVLCIAEAEDSGEPLVVYQALYGENRIYARSLASFTEELDPEKYPEADQIHRFEKVEREEPGPVEEAENAEEGPDPLVGRFLDAHSAAERMEILRSLRTRVTDQMIDTMAMACGLEIEEGPLEQRLEDLEGCLATIDRYETDRGRLR